MLGYLLGQGPRRCALDYRSSLHTAGGLVLLLLALGAVGVACNPLTGPDESRSGEIRPPLAFAGARFTDPSLGGGLIVEAFVHGSAPAPQLHDFVPVAVRTSAGDRETVTLRRAWNDRDSGLYQIHIGLGAGATIDGPIRARLPEIGAVYLRGFDRYPHVGSYVTSAPYEWARVVAESWPGVARVEASNAVRFDFTDPWDRLMMGGVPLHVTESEPIPQDGRLQVGEGDTVVVEYESPAASLGPSATLEWRAP